MTLKAYKKRNYNNPATFDIQKNVEDIYNQIKAAPFLSGYQFKEIALTTGNNTIENKFKSSLQGFFITNKNASSIVFLVSSDENEIILNASANCTVDIWVF